MRRNKNNRSRAFSSWQITIPVSVCALFIILILSYTAIALNEGSFRVNFETNFPNFKLETVIDKREQNTKEQKAKMSRERKASSSLQPC